MAAFVTKLKFHPIARALSKSRAFKNEARKVANAKFQRAKNSLINNFNSHPVTREIEAGPEADNSSRTLGGSGNLFTFIGFFREDNPVEMVRNALQRHIKITSGKFTSRSFLRLSSSSLVQISCSFRMTSFSFSSGRPFFFASEK